MALNMTQKTTFTGTSDVNNVTCERFYAWIDIDNPEKMSIQHSILNGDAYRDHREECEKDETEFDNVVLAVQEELEQEDAKVENVETDDENVETEEEVEQ